jgi:hypothetical protein
MSRFALPAGATPSPAAGQTPLDLGGDDTLIQGHPLPPDSCEERGFAIGWDHAHHGLVPPAELLLEGTPVAQGWRAGKAVYGARTLAAGRMVRQWLTLRLLAWRSGMAFDDLAVTPNHLKQIETTHCPITRSALGGTATALTAAQIDRVNPQAGYAAGNLVVLSRAAALAREGLTTQQTLSRARQAERCQALGLPADDLNAAAWWRLAALASFATPLSYAEAAGVPLAVLPPNRARVLNVAQCLQALLTLQFTLPHWSERMTAFASWLPAEQGLRTDFHLFVGALAPRVLEASNPSCKASTHANSHTSTDLRRALEDAWLQPRVQRRWLQFALALGEARASILAERLANLPLPGKAARWHGIQQALDGWALPAGAAAAAGAGAADAGVGFVPKDVAAGAATLAAPAAAAARPTARPHAAASGTQLDLEIAMQRQEASVQQANAKSYKAAQRSHHKARGPAQNA